MSGGARIGRPRSGGSVPVSAVTPGQVAKARRDLGRQLAVWRGTAGLTQTELARRVSYSRSTVANVEIGRECNNRQFWECADREVSADGALLAAFEQVDTLVQAVRTQAAQAREQRWAAQYAPPVLSVMAGWCGCGIAVGRWTGREILALREALRMSVRVFAEHLGVTVSAVSGWEHRTQPAPPSLAMQAVLDQALKLADADTRTRFAALLGSDADRPCDTGMSTAGSVAGGSVVTTLRRPERTRSVS